MKVGALGYYPNNNIKFLNNTKSNTDNKNVGTKAGYASYSSIFSSSFPSSAFNSNFNISFKGVECHPSNFKIKMAYGVICPCCGHVMLTKKQSNAFVARVSNKTGEDLQKELEKELPYFRENEKQIANILISDSKNNPDMDLSQLVTLEARDGIGSLECSQKAIINDIRKQAEGLSSKKREQLLSILDDEESLIDNSDDFVHFKRRNFVDKIEKFKIRCVGKDKETASYISDLAKNMPTSAMNKDAFFVKYKRRTNADIARRLVLPSLATTEHIRPQSKNGKNNTDNYIPLCSDCNSRRGNISYSEWFKIHPEMPSNLQEYLNQVSAMIKNKEFIGWEIYDTYIDDVIKAVYEETNGALRLKKPEEIEAQDADNSDTMPERSQRSIDEQRTIWMSKYQSLIEKVEGLVNLRDTLYSDDEFLNIIKYLNLENQLSASKKNRKALHNNYMNATSAHKRIQREIKKAKKDGESSETLKKLEAKAKSAKEILDAAKISFVDESSRYTALVQERDAVRKKITTVEDVAAEIKKLKQRKLESEQKQSEVAESSVGQSNSTELAFLRQSSGSLSNKIKELNERNLEKEKVLNFDSPKSKKTASRYFELQAKIAMIDSIDMETFRKLFSDNFSSIGPDFIIEEAKSAIQRQLKNILQNPIANYYQTKAEIEELEYKKRVIDAEIAKLTANIDYDAKIQALYRKKADVQRKFANVNIDETIARIQKEADDYLQKYADSFENENSFQHSKPKVETSSSASS